MNVTCIFFGILFTIAGFLFACGKGHIHLSAWKEIPQEEKKRIQIVPLCRNIGEVIALNGMIFLRKGCCAGFTSHWFVMAMIAWFIVAGFDVWYIEKSNRYYRREPQKKEV